jgi:hypothetical protein
MNYRQFLIKTGLSPSSVDNYCKALFDPRKSNHSTAQNWYQKYLDTKSDQPFIQYLLKQNLSMSTARTYLSGVNNPDSSHHEIGMKWYKQFLSVQIHSVEPTTVEEPTPKIVKVEEPQPLKEIETIQIILKMSVTDKQKLAMIKLLL